MSNFKGILPLLKPAGVKSKSRVTVLNTNMLKNQGFSLVFRNFLYLALSSSNIPLETGCVDGGLSPRAISERAIDKRISKQEFLTLITFQMNKLEIMAVHVEIFLWLTIYIEHVSVKLQFCFANININIFLSLPDSGVYTFYENLPFRLFIIEWYGIKT